MPWEMEVRARGPWVQELRECGTLGFVNIFERNRDF